VVSCVFNSLGPAEGPDPRAPGSAPHLRLDGLLCARPSTMRFSSWRTLLLLLPAVVQAFVVLPSGEPALGHLDTASNLLPTRLVPIRA
jgi:hypothetical protein